MNVLPEAWTLDLTKDELDLYSNLVPDYVSGTVKSEFALRKEVTVSEMQLWEVIEFFKDPDNEVYDDFFCYDDEGNTILVLTGSTPLLNDDEKAVYDTLMAKIRARHKEVILEQIENCKQTIERLETELEEYVW